jgi:micrococcal nuclease
MSMYDNNRYSAEIIRWVDGDTLDLRVDLGQKVCVRDKYRLARVDAPETRLRKGVTKKEKEAGIRLTETLNSKFPPGTVVEVATSKAGKYGRWLIEMWVMDHGTELRYNLSTWLLEEGLAQEWK